MDGVREEDLPSSLVSGTGAGGRYTNSEGLCGTVGRREQCELCILNSLLVWGDTIVTL